VLGLFPKGWRMPLVYRRDNDKHEILVRLMGIQRQGGEGDDEEERPRRPPRGPQPPEPKEKEKEKEGPPSPALKLFEKKAGFANYYFNKLERDRLLTGFRKQGDFSTLTGDWVVEAEAEVKNRKTDSRLIVREERDKDGKADRTLVTLHLGAIKFDLEPLRAGQDVQNLKDPAGSGGLLLAWYQYRRLLTLGEKGFEGGFSHGGQEPFYPPPPDGRKVDSYRDLRVDAEVLRTEHGGIPVKWYFSLKDQTLLGFEMTVVNNEDPCEVYFADYKPVDGRSLPHRIEVRYGNDKFGVFTVKSYQLAAAK
jgi:hypothetical protein